MSESPPFPPFLIRNKNRPTYRRRRKLTALPPSAHAITTFALARRAPDALADIVLRLELDAARGQFPMGRCQVGLELVVGRQRMSEPPSWSGSSASRRRHHAAAGLLWNASLATAS